ncbi:MAG: transposase [Cyanobacteria bacterium J06635_10]
MLLGSKYKLIPKQQQVDRFISWLNMGRALFNYSLNDIEATYHLRFAQGEFCSLITKAVCCPLTCPVGSSSATSDTGEIYQTSKDGVISRKSAKNIQKTNLPTLKQVRSWYRDVDSTALQDVIDRLHDAFSKFFSGEAKYPKYKNRSNFKSLTIKSGIVIDGNRIKLGKLGWMRFHNSRPIPDGFKIQSATIRLKADGLYVSIKIKDKSVPAFPIISPEEVKTAAGMDMGITKLVHFSDGSQVDNPKLSTNKKSRRTLRIRQRRISRKKKGSKNRSKAGNRVARTYQKITNKREALHWKIASKAVKKADALFAEDLNISGMKSRCKPKKDEANKGRFLPNGQSRKRGLNRSISDASWYSLLKKIEYMAAKHGKLFLKVNPRYSSQECPKCGHVHKDNRNKEKFICTNCGHIAHADLKAAVTVKQRGVEALGLTLSCRAKHDKNLVRRDSSKPAQLDLGLELCEMPTSESTEGKRRRSARL